MKGFLCLFFQNLCRWHLLKVLQWACQFLIVQNFIWKIYLQVALIESIAMSLLIPNCLLVSYIKLSERFFCVYFSKSSPVALIESVTMSRSIPSCLIVSYVRNFIWKIILCLFFKIFADGTYWKYCKFEPVNS